jgi:hypothetical protein
VAVNGDHPELVLKVDGELVARELGVAGKFVGLGFVAVDDDGTALDCWLVIETRAAEHLLERLWAAVLEATDRTPQ